MTQYIALITLLIFLLTYSLILQLIRINPNGKPKVVKKFIHVSTKLFKIQFGQTIDYLGQDEKQCEKAKEDDQNNNQ